MSNNDKKVLVHRGKHGNTVVDASEDELAAYRWLFDYFDETLNFYGFINDDHQRDLYESAKSGDDKAVKRLIHFRSGYEYEKVEVCKMVDPT